MSSRVKRLRKPKKRACRQCAAGNHTGHAHYVCPACELRIEPGREHGHLIGGQWVTFRA